MATKVSGILQRLQSMVSSLSLAVAICVLMLSSFSMLYPARAGALQLGPRTLRIESSVAGATTRHNFTFTYTTTTTAVGSIVIEYCTSPLIEITCDGPVGLDASAAVLADQTGEIGFSLLTAQTNKLVLTRTPAVNPTNNPSSYTFDTVVNPTGVPGAFYARISTYTTQDGTGTSTDFGAVVSSTSEGVHISTEVPPILKFCVGIVLADDCTTADESVVDLGDLSTTKVAGGSSQMIAATNAEFGLAIAAYGTTLTSGNNVITAPSTPTVSAPGNAQFGLNLRSNTNPAIGQNPTGIGIINPTSNYDIPNRYMFDSGAVIATSSAATDTRKLTASYIANISPTQPPGVYTATLTYICTATF